MALKDNPEKARAIELGEAAGEEFSDRAFKAGGVLAMRDAVESRDWEQRALNAFFTDAADVHPEMAATPVRVHPYYLRAYCEVFARGACRYAENVLLGMRDAQMPALDRSQLARNHGALRTRKEYHAIRAQIEAEKLEDDTRSDVEMDDDALEAYVWLTRKYALNPERRPLLTQAYEAGWALGKAV
jgi:hypothetical protein